MFHSRCLFLKLQARTQAAKVMALSSVVQGKEVESDAIVLHRQLERESLSIYSGFFSTPYHLHYCFC